MTGEFVIIHRKKGKREAKENLIASIPNEGIYNLISRIKPNGDDEIVIKVVDYDLIPNIEASRVLTDMYESSAEERKLAILTGGTTETGVQDKDDLPF
jgi:protein associated with RNAse G/E